MTSDSQASGISLRSVARNSILIFAFQILTKILGFLSSIFLANFLGAELFGTYNYAFALTSLFIPLCDLGIDVYLVREVARQETSSSQKQFGLVLVVKVLLAAGVLALVTSTALILESSQSESFLFVVLAGMVTILRTYWVSFSSVLRAVNRVWEEAWLYSTARIVEFAVIVYCIWSAASVLTI